MVQLDKNTKIFLAVIAALVILIPVVSAAVYYSITLRASGTIKTVGCEVYADPDASLVLTQIAWGEVEPGSLHARTIYVKVLGTTSDVTLDLQITNWQPPEAETALSCYWDYDGSTLQPNEVVGVNIYLEISPNVVGIAEFAFDITVIAGG